MKGSGLPLFELLIACGSLAAVGFAHIQLPHFTAGRRNLLLTRAALFGVGIAVGYVAAATQGGDAGRALLAFVTGFGAAHIPAAFIVLIKRERGEGKS